MGEITLAAAIAAIIQWIKNFDPQGKVSGWVTLPVAILIGAISGYFHFLGTTSVEVGIVAGFVAVGACTVVSKAGGK